MGLQGDMMLPETRSRILAAMKPEVMTVEEILHRGKFRSSGHIRSWLKELIAEGLIEPVKLDRKNVNCRGGGPIKNGYGLKSGAKS